MSKQYFTHQPHSMDERFERALYLGLLDRGRRLQWTVCNGEVELRGNVRSYYEKQLAQESLVGIPGVERIRNQLIVER